MKRKVAIQIDSIPSLDLKNDSSIILGLEAQLRGFEIWTYQPENLFVLNGEIFTKAQKTVFSSDKNKPPLLKNLKNKKLIDFDVILMRQDPPFNMHYITATYFLSQVKDKVLVVNNPDTVRNHPEKILPLQFKEFMPPTLMSNSLDEIKNFYRINNDIIIKPLYGNGGIGVELVRKNSKNLEEIVKKTLLEYDEAPLIAQAFIKEVFEGDKRIILIDGEVAGVLNRVPAAGDIRANMAAGASAYLSELSAADKKICKALKRFLKKNGILFAGIDVIAGRLTEINITSPTGIAAIKNLGGPDIEKIFWDCIEQKL